LGAAAIATDITDQKLTEKDLTAALKELSYNIEKIQTLNEKLGVVGSLTRHDVRNKLSAITAYSYILKKKHADKPDVVESLDKIVEAVKASTKIFDFAKAYEQLGVEELVDVDLDKVVGEAAEMFSGLPFKVVNECHGLTVRADSLLRQLVYNFIDNTRKYGQKTTVARVSYEKAASDDLQLIYEDDGVGIPSENKAQIFNQGFSTGGSTGFGLFLSKKMIEVYGWTLAEEGKPGEGARFVITIPKIDKDGKINYQNSINRENKNT
jgi:signal transduction histidine kinase